MMPIENISLTEIDHDDTTYSLSPEYPVEAPAKLIASIARFGIMVPPVIRKTESGSHKIVDGRKRLHVLNSLQPGSSCCCLVIPAGIDELEVYHILLEGMQMTRQLTLVEKAIFLQKTGPIFSDELITREFMVRIGLPPSPSAIKKTLEILDLEPEILVAIHHGFIHETVGCQFIALSAKDRKTLFQIITGLHLSVSYQKKLLNICLELAGRLNKNITEIFDNEEVYEILEHRDANPPQKTKNLMDWLLRKYRPRYQQAEDEFGHFISAMHLPQNVSVVHTPFFEDDSVTLAITFPEKKSLQRAWDTIRHAIRRHEN